MLGDRGRRSSAGVLGPDGKRLELHFARPDARVQTSADMVLVSNNAYRLESMQGFGTRARIDEGVLGVVTMVVDRSRAVPALTSAEATGGSGASAATGPRARRSSSWERLRYSPTR